MPTFCRRTLSLLTLVVFPGTAAAAQECDHQGTIQVVIEAANQTLPGRIDLGCRDGRHWGRFLAVLSDTFTTVLAERGREGDSLRFVSFGGATGAVLRVRGDSVFGAILVGRALPLRGAFQSRTPADWISPHATLAPWSDLAVPEDSGHSYPVPITRDSLLFTRHGGTLAWQRIMIAVREGGQWTASAIVPARHESESQRGPAVAPDGSLWFSSTRADSTGGAPVSGYRLWMAPRQGVRWGAPRLVELPAADGPGDQQPSVTRDGWVYFTSHREGGLGDRDIWRFRRDNPATSLEVLPAPINSPGDEHGVWVSADHRLLIIASAGARPGRIGGDDLYVATGSGGTWGNVVVLPIPVNTFGNEYGATLSGDGGTLWFTSDRFGLPSLFRIANGSLGVRLR